MHKWYVVQVFSSQEKKVKKCLEDHALAHGVKEDITEVLLPTENVSEVKGGERKVSEKRIWPGYLLVKMNLTDGSWAYVTETNGVIGFLGGADPTALSDAEVQGLLSDLKTKKEKVTQKYQFTIGDRVKITDGVFINFVGEVCEVFMDKGRLSVMVSIFGRDTRVDDLELWQVEEVAEEEVS